MGFYRSSFLFVYNIPSFVTEQMVLSNVRRLEYVKFMPQFYDNMRCGFGLVEVDDSRMSAEESEQVTTEVLGLIREKKFSGQQIEVDEVWFKSAGADTEPPHQDLLKSNFVFVYNMPSNGYTMGDLQELTTSNNVIFLPEIDDDTRCAFVEVPELSEFDWDRLLTKVRQHTRRGCRFSVDEIWLNPAAEAAPPAVSAPGPEVAAPPQAAPVIRGYQPPQPPQPPQPTQPPAELLSMPPTAVVSAPSGWPVGWPGGGPHAASPWPAWPGQVMGTPSAATTMLPPPGVPPMTGMPPNSWHGPPAAPAPPAPPAPPTVENRALKDMERVLSGRLLHSAMPTLLDDEVRALAETVSTNLPQLQANVQTRQPGSLPILFANVQAVNAEQSSRRGGQLPAGGMEEEARKRNVVSAISKMELTTNTAALLPMVQTTKRPSAGSAPEAMKMEPPAKKFADDPEPGTSYLFVNRIPKSLPLIQLLAGVPRVENFVFSESSDEHTKSGFAFLKSDSNFLLPEIVAAFRRNGADIGVYRVRLEPLTEGSPRPVPPPSGPPPELPPPPPPPSAALVHFSLGGGQKEKMETKPEPMRMLSEDEKQFMETTGFNDPRAPVVYCVEVRGMPITTSEPSFSKLVKDKIPRVHEFCLLTEASNKSRRALFFGGSHEEAVALMTKLKSLLQNAHHKLDFSVLLTNRPDRLAPIPQRVSSEIKTRRLILFNLPDWPVELLLMRIGKFVPKAMAFLAPRVDDPTQTTLGHVYLGYESHEDADADLYRLSDWKLTSSENVCVKLVVDTGWGKDGPLTGEDAGSYRQLERILRYRREVGADQVKVYSMSDALAKYKNGPPVTSDLHSVLSRFIYEGSRETLYSMVIRRLPARLDLDNFIRRIVKGKLGGLEAASMLSVTGEHKEIIVFFGSRESAAVDHACSTFRQLAGSRDRDLMAALQHELSQPEVERHLGDTFVPVTKDFAMRRGCQFLMFSSIPGDVDRTDCLYGLRSLCPNARSFYVPTASGQSGGADFGRVLGYAVARFTDPRQCRSAFLALSPTCTLAGSTIRVSFAALHKVLSTTYLDRTYSVPLHVWFPWMRYNPESVGSDPWVADNTSRSPFFCTCHHVVLPFRPTQFKGIGGSWRRSK